MAQLQVPRTSAPASWDQVQAPRKNVDVPEGLWLKCPACAEMIYRKTMEEQDHCCPVCRHHFRVGAEERIQMLVDPGSFEEMDETIGPKDFLAFTDKKSYAKRLADEQKKTGTKDGLTAGRAVFTSREHPCQG